MKRLYLVQPAVPNEPSIGTPIDFADLADMPLLVADPLLTRMMVDKLQSEAAIAGISLQIRNVLPSTSLVKNSVEGRRRRDRAALRRRKAGVRAKAPACPPNRGAGPDAQCLLALACRSAAAARRATTHPRRHLRANLRRAGTRPFRPSCLLSRKHGCRRTRLSLGS